MGRLAKAITNSTAAETAPLPLRVLMFNLPYRSESYMANLARGFSRFHLEPIPDTNAAAILHAAERYGFGRI
jgi:hypothetical protein